MIVRFGQQGLFQQVPTRQQQPDAFQRATVAKQCSERLGFAKATRFDELDGILNHLKSEVDEFRATVVNGESKARQLDELGDILYITNWVADFKQLSAGEALHHAADKFVNRMTTIETIVQQRWPGKPLNTLQKDQWLALWKEAKKRLENRPD